MTDLGACVGGIDEAGRGALLGPLVVAGVAVDEDSLVRLKSFGVRDSKQLSPRRREQLYPLIREAARKVSVIEISPHEIDVRGKRGINLNELELQKMAQIAESLGCETVYVDAVDTDEQRFGAMLSKRVPGIRFVSEHRADEVYVVTGAASIVAKVTRDARIRELQGVYGPLGSGYPSDPRTTEFVKRYYITEGRLPDFVRSTWKTVAKLKLK
ncbi:MAG: ribonuclease HII [Candidatus Marsarchaeota archaeon]|nr:ribonuclease HII [Candidatus Marsarchaeota archaeon]